MRLIISFLLFLVFANGFAQKTQISEQEYLDLQDKIRFSMNANADTGLAYTVKLMKSNDEKHLAFAYSAASYLYQIKGNVAKSDENYKAAISHLDKMPASSEKTKLTGYVFNYRGLTEWKRGNLGKALDNYQRGIKFSTEVNDVIQMVKFKSNIALINEEIGNYQLAIKNLRQNDNFINKTKTYIPGISFKTARVT